LFAAEGGVTHRPTGERRNLVTDIAGRRVLVWPVAMLGIGLIIALAPVVLAFGSTAQAQIEAQHLAADLRISKAVKPKVVPVGSKQTFIIKVTNQRGTTARGVTMSDPLPKGLNFVRASTSRQVPGSCGKSGRTVECRLGTLRVGSSVTVKIIVKPTRRGGYLNRAFVEHTTAELQSSDNIDLARARGTRR
jgi:uncharacterized repeat protein (TIGR01451 family)